ncbi:MAG: sulfotransferase [Myxococcota bacterium]
MSQKNDALDAPVFLVGTTRSGTTVLSLMLGSHPALAHLGEFEWPWDFPSDEDRPDLAEYHHWLSTNRHFNHHRVEIDSALGFDDLVRSFLEQMWEMDDPERECKALVTQVHRHYEQALRIWPNARFIHIVRDGRDVCASWIKFAWLGNGHRAGHDWKAAMEEWRAAERLIDPANRIELRFEDLINDVENQLARLCEFLGLPYDEAMLRYHEHTTYGPIDPNQAGKWQTGLDRRHLRLFEAVAGEELEAQGYPRSDEPAYAMRPWSRLWLRIDDAIRHNLGRVEKYGFSIWFWDHLTRRLPIAGAHDAVQLRINAVENSKVQ